MKKILRSRIIRMLPGLLVRLSSVWLLASFAILYYGGQTSGARSVIARFCLPGQYNLIWPVVFFIISLVFSLLLYYWNPGKDNSADQ